MAAIDLTWIEDRRFLGVDSTGHSVVLSPPNDVGVKPSDALLIALGACAAFDVVEILRKQRFDPQRMAVRVTGDQAPNPPWTYQRIHLQFTITALNGRQDQLDRAVDLAINKYCSVRASLAPTIEVTFEAELRHLDVAPADGVRG